MAQISITSTQIASDHSYRRRQLFPTIDDDSDDLGHISPLSNSSPPDSPIRLSPNYKEHNTPSTFNKSTLADYDILENINDINKKPLEFVDASAENRTPNNRHNYLQSEASMSPLYLSPVVSSLIKQKQKTGDDTPSRKSPIQTLKTPQDSCSVNTNLPKLIRKSIDGSTSKECGKRKMPFSESPPNTKHPKLDPGSKVRTVLFPRPEGSLSTASFYSKVENAYLGVLKNNSVHTKKTTSSKSSALYLCGRKTNKKRLGHGEINAGVRHKIRKPKPKKIVKSHLLQAALNIMENSPLNNYLKELENMTPLPKSNQELNEPLMPALSVAESLQRQAKDNNEMEKMLEEKPESRKRELSPPPDPTKKFFKFKRSNATVTVEKHLKLKVDDGRISLLEAKQVSKKREVQRKLNLDASDLVVPDKDNLISPVKIDEILFNLENDDDKDKENDTNICQTINTDCTEQFVLEAHNSVTMSENSIHLHVSSDNQCKDLRKSILLSPTSQMCNMTSGLALNSPKKFKRNLNITNETSSALDMEQKKLFPIFYGAQNTPPKTSKSPKNVLNPKKYKLLPKNQMLLDAGQKRFGVTQCNECKFVYHMGDPNEELMHLNYHNAGHIFRFIGWKDERIMAQFPNARIIKVLPCDPKPWVRKVKDLLEVVNRDLGYYEMPFGLDNTQVYLYIKNKTITGCLVAEPKSTAYRLLSGDVGIDLCSEHSYPIKCGVNRIWVSQGHRKEGIGTSLMNSLRGNFIFGGILSTDDIAFSSPTEAGKAFATKYFNTPNFFVYM